MIRLQSASLGEWDRGQNYLPYKTGFCTEHDKQGAFCNVRHTDHGGQNVIFTLHTDHDDPLFAGLCCDQGSSQEATSVD